MIRTRITEARRAAERFLSAIDQMEEREAQNAHFRHPTYVGGFKESATLRRASMDLTRALASMRKSS